MEARCKVILNTLMKLKREGSGFINEKDKGNVKELIKNMREYIYFSMDILETLRFIKKKRMEEEEGRKREDVLDVKKVTNGDLKENKVSKKEFE